MVQTFNYFGQRFRVRYVVNDKGVPHFSMRVPKELVSRYGKSLLRVKLEPRNGPLAMQANARELGAALSVPDPQAFETKEKTRALLKHLVELKKQAEIEARNSAKILFYM